MNFNYWKILIFLLSSINLSKIVLTMSSEKMGSNEKFMNKELLNNSASNWENILREVVFKTISSPPQPNDTLYKKLLEAPFYGGPLPISPNEDNALLSRGDVYHLSDGQWILCQENCINCIICDNEKNSIVKWALTRVKRFLSADSYRYDLELTIVPQSNNSTRQHFQAGNFIYVPRESTTTTRNVTVTTETSHINRSRSGRSWRRMTRDDKNQVESNKYFVSTNETDSKNSSPTHRLIMGIDKSGKKHVAHVMSIGPSIISINNHTTNETIHQFNPNFHELSYQQYIVKLLQSINSHQPIIKSFLSYRQVRDENLINKNSNARSNVIMKLNELSATRNWSQILTQVSRDKNYIPTLIKKLNFNQN